MRYALLILIAVCGSAFGQNGPDKTVEDLAKKRIGKLDLFGTQPVLAGGPVSVSLGKKPAVCSIPLLNSRPAGNYRMPVIQAPMGPQSSSRELKLEVPAPACDEKLFRNR